MHSKIFMFTLYYYMAKICFSTIPHFYFSFDQFIIKAMITHTIFNDNRCEAIDYRGFCISDIMLNNNANIKSCF